MLALLTGCSAGSDGEEGGPANIRAIEISNFKQGSSETRFGSLEFIGGLELSSDNALLGAISAIRFRPDQRQFISVLDTGHWLTGTIERDDKGRLKGIADARIRRIAGSDIKPGAVVDGRVIFKADTRDQIDNLEGIDVFRAADGSIHVILISDDNHSILQRSLMLEFRLLDDQMLSRN